MTKSKEHIIEILKKLIIKANTELRPDVQKALLEAIEEESDPNGLKALEALKENVLIARNEQIPLCQDTGYVDIYFEGNWDGSIDFQSAADEAVRQAYKEMSFRASIVADPLYERKNSGDNTPANVILSGANSDQLTINVLVKGAGSDNASALFMLNPSSSEQDIIDLVVGHVKGNGAKSCPPLIIGIGIGSSFDKVAALSKKALLRPINRQPSTANRQDTDKTAAKLEDKYLRLEQELLKEINNLGIGPSALGGKTTALAVNIEEAPTHMATLPVAINLNCYALRSASATFGGSK